MSSMGMVYYSADPVGYGNNILHHIPNGLAPGFQACLIVYAICCGVMGLEILSNLDYDFALARRSGWLDKSKCPNRIAYFVSRYGALVFLVNVLIFSTVGGLRCETFGRANQFMWLIPLSCVDFIFIQRTLALYGWSKKLSILLYLYFIADVAFATAAIGWFGIGYVIPGSDFCAFFTTNGDVLHDYLFIGYNIVLNSLDMLILLLTCHRLIEGGLLAIPKLISERCFKVFAKQDSNRHSNLGIIPKRETISALLIRQGLHYYFILLVVRLAYLIVYYLSTSGQSVYQVLGTAILATVGPVLANRLFRETSDFVRARTVIRSNHNHTDDRITGGGGCNRSIHQGAGGHPMTMATKSSSYKMQTVRPEINKSSSLFDDDDDDEDNDDDYTSISRPRSNPKGLKIYVNERMSSFIDDYDDKAPVGLPRLPPQRHLSWAEPPQLPSSTYRSSINQRPFINTVAVSVPSESTSSSSPSPYSVSPQREHQSEHQHAFDIRLKRANSAAHQPWI